MNALEKLRQCAIDAKSEALLVWRDGRFLLEWYADDTARQPIELMSCTKSIVSLCIGVLLDERSLTSLDQPVAHFYPEWKQGRKARVTVRHLLTHTSGLQNVPLTTEEIYPSPDFVRLALAAELSAEPGTRFCYNNKAVNLLAGIVERASGRPIDEFCADRFFAPMNIREHFWQRDPAAIHGSRLHGRRVSRPVPPCFPRSEGRGGPNDPQGRFRRFRRTHRPVRRRLRRAYDVAPSLRNPQIAAPRSN